MCLSPDSHWLLVACSHGMLKILPVLPVLIENCLSFGEWETQDIDTLLNIRYPIESNPIKSNPFKSNPIKSNQIKSNQIKSNQIKSKPADIGYCVDY